MLDKRKKLAFERIWLKPANYLSFISVQFYGNAFKQAFIKISSAVDICGVCLGRAPSMAAQCGWGHYLSPSSPCLYAFIARLDDTVGVYFFLNPLFMTRTAQRVTFLNNAWVRLVMAKSEKSAREKRKCGAHERERDLRMRWKSPIVTAVVSVWVLATESSQHPVNWAQNDGHLCTSRIFCLPRSHVLLFSFSILTDVLILLNVVTMHTFVLLL